MSDPTTVHFCPDFTDTDADLIIASSDEVYFRVHKFILGKASPIFLDMFAIPTSLDDAEGPQTVQLSESSWAVEAMLRMCYPMARHILTDLWQAIELLAIGRKYSMQAVVDGATSAVASWSYEGEQAPGFFAFAVHIGDEQLIKRGVVECLRMSFSDLVDANATGLELIPAFTFQELLQLHRRCTTTAIHTASSFPWLAYEDRPWCSGCRNQIFVPENGMKPDTLHRFILDRTVQWWNDWQKEFQRVFESRDASPLNSFHHLLSAHFRPPPCTLTCPRCQEMGSFEFVKFMRAVDKKIEKAVMEDVHHWLKSRNSRI